MNLLLPRKCQISLQRSKQTRKIQQRSSRYNPMLVLTVPLSFRPQSYFHFNRTPWASTSTVKCLEQTRMWLLVVDRQQTVSRRTWLLRTWHRQLCHTLVQTTSQPMMTLRVLPYLTNHSSMKPTGICIKYTTISYRHQYLLLLGYFPFCPTIGQNMTSSSFPQLLLGTILWLNSCQKTTSNWGTTKIHRCLLDKEHRSDKILSLP